MRLRRWVELVADYDVDVAYHPGKANQVAHALSRRRKGVTEIQEFQDLKGALAYHRLSATPVENGEITGLEVVCPADLLWRIRETQKDDAALQKVVDKGVIGYYLAINGTILFRNRVCVLENKDLKDEILEQVHQSRFSIHPGSTKMYHDLKWYYHWYNMNRELEAYVA